MGGAPVGLRPLFILGGCVVFALLLRLLASLLPSSWFDALRAVLPFHTETLVLSSVVLWSLAVCV